MISTHLIREAQCNFFSSLLARKLAGAGTEVLGDVECHLAEDNRTVIFAAEFGVDYVSAPVVLPLAISPETFDHRALRDRFNEFDLIAMFPVDAAEKA